MPRIFQHLTDCASLGPDCIVGLSEREAADDHIVFQQQWAFGGNDVYSGTIVLDQGNVVSSTRTIYTPLNQMSQQEKEFNEQKQAFLSIPPIILAPYNGQYIVVHNGEILDSDSDLPTLTSRFFAENGDLPVYVTKVGEEINVIIDTPFLD